MKAGAVIGRTLLATLALSISPQAQDKGSQSTEDSCRLFAQEFYDWYVPNTHVKEAKKNGMTALEFSIKTRRSSFDPDLVRLLDEGRAQAKRDGQPFLDFDPVLNSQDPPDSYLVKKIALKGGQCRADVYGEPPGRNGGKPDVVAELTSKDGQWRFTDFYYPNSQHPDNKSLLRMLRFLRKREESPSQ